MNFDLIIKLIKLANNNPNDNEANLAARKVCTLLKDHKFINQPTTWNDVQRAPEPQWKSTPPTESFDWTKTPFFEEFFRRREKEREYYYRRPPREVKIDPDPWVYDPLTGKKKRPVEDRDLECKTCHKVVKTKFVGHSQLFECNTCQWTAYERTKSL